LAEFRKEIWFFLFLLPFFLFNELNEYFNKTMLRRVLNLGSRNASLAGGGLRNNIPTGAALIRS
jgi:hypothetical protein